MSIVIRASTGLAGTVTVPGDKAISHRAVIFGAVADGETTATNWLDSRATRSTVSCVRALGVPVEVSRVEDRMVARISGRGDVSQLRPPTAPLHCGRSATTMRLLMGLLAGSAFETTLDGDPVLNARPMERIAVPLRRMGARIDTGYGGGGPVVVRGAPLVPVDYVSPVASAHLHTAILLAALNTHGRTVIRQPGAARDHAVHLLRAMGAKVRQDHFDVILDASGQSLRAADLLIGGDMSAAAYWIVAATLVPGSELRILDVGLNPTRLGLVDAFQQMGADITVTRVASSGGEPIGDLLVRAARLTGVDVSSVLTLRMIDDIPAFALAAACAHGRTTVRDAAEARTKDSDRIGATVRQLRRLGASVTERPDGFEIDGPQRLRGGTVGGETDHRISLAMCVAGLVADGTTVVTDPDEFCESYPGFVDDLAVVGAKVAEVA